jgi:tRNA nucleotidyltransferase (CCA-adding enzyme)
VLLFELASRTIPAVERHEGPPVHVGDHAAGFYDAYADSESCGPFLDGDRYVVERDRAYRDAVTFLRETGFSEIALGAQIEAALADSYTVHADAAVPDLAVPFGVELRRYFEPRV